MAIQLPYTGGTTDETLPTPYTNGGGSIDLTLKEDKANKGVANGYAPLDANSKVPTANLPDQAALDAEVDGKITTHNSATTSVHGIANTANLVLTSDSRLSDSRTPTAHTHTKSQITDFTHTHAVADVTGLQTALDGKQASGSYAPATGISPTAITGTAVITTDSRLSDSRTPTAHAHTIADVTSLQTTLDGKASSSHTHTISDVTNLQTALDGKQASGSYAPASGIAPSAITGTAVVTNDSRLTDNRAPTSHTHGNITNAGAVGSTANLPLITTTSGVVTTGSFGTTANSFCQGNDSRLSDARTPTAHTHSISEVTSLQATLTAFAIALG